MAIDYQGFAYPKGSLRIEAKREKRLPVDKTPKRSACAGCGKVFQSVRRVNTRPPTKYCNPACARKYAGRANWKPRQPCPVCGGRVLSGSKACCSKRCMVVQQRTLKQRTCPSCQQVYQPSRAAQAFCSLKCWKQANGASYQTVTCAQCARIYNVNEKRIRRGQSRHFCNRVCLRKFLSVPENTPHYRGGHDANRGPKWHKRAAEIRDRDQHVCQRCGRTEAENGQKLDVDHILPWRSFEAMGRVELANDPTNLTSLCKKCHTIKTATIERAWLTRGDCLAMSEYQRTIKLTSARRHVPA